MLVPNNSYSAKQVLETSLSHGFSGVVGLSRTSAIMQVNFVMAGNPRLHFNGISFFFFPVTFYK